MSDLSAALETKNGSSSQEVGKQAERLKLHEEELGKIQQDLAELKVAYREIDITAVPEARRILRGLAGGDLSIPTIQFEDGRVLIEPTRQTLLEALRQRGTNA